MTDAHAGGIEPRHCRGEGCSDGRVQPVERQPFGNAEAQSGKRDRLGRGEFFTGHHRVGFGAIRNAARNRSYRIERLAQRKGAAGRDTLPARLETNDAAQCCRNTDRTAGVAADCDLAHAVGSGDAGARRRGEKRLVGRDQRNAALISEIDQARFRGALGRHAVALQFDIETVAEQALQFLAARQRQWILSADDRAIERAERHAVSGAGVGRIGRRAGSFGIDSEARPRALPLRVGDARQSLFKTIAAGERFHGNVRS